MTKTISASTQSHLEGETTTLATCWRMELTFEQPKIREIQRSNPCTLVTKYPHLYSTGDQVGFAFVSGMTEINDVFENSVVVTSAQGLTLPNVDSTGFSVYSSSTSAEVQQVHGFTNHDVDVYVSNVRYDAETGTTPTELTGSSNLAVDNAEFEGILQSPAIDEVKILWGAYDYARLTILLANYEDTGEIVLMRTGRLGQVTVERDEFSAEFRSLVAALAQDTTSVYSPGCRATLGDTECGVDLVPFESTSVVASVISAKRSFEDSVVAGFASAYFDGGKLLWTTGDNVGRTREIKSHQASALELLDALPFSISAGDAYIATPGCDKAIDTCETKFDNTINFRGFPHLPGLAAMLEGGDRNTVDVDDTP